MSFKGTSNSIVALKNKPTPISTNELLKMMEVAAEDVFEHNKVAPSVSNLKADDPKALLLSTVRLLNTLITVCDDNRDSIGDLSSIIQRKLNTARTQAVNWQQEWSAVCDEITAAEEEAERLQSQLDQLEVKRGHLLTLKDQCAAIQEKIDVLSDSRLDRLAEEKQELDAEFSRRLAIATERKEALREIKEKLAQQQEVLDEINAQISADSAALDQFQSNQASAQQEKERLMEEVRSVSGQCRALEEWLDNFPAWSETLYQEFHELQDRSSLLLNAWNSLWNDRFLATGIGQLPQDAQRRILAKLSVPSNAFRTIQELEEWFRDVCLCVRELTTQCEDKLQILVAQAKQFTAPVPNDNGGA